MEIDLPSLLFTLYADHQFDRELIGQLDSLAAQADEKIKNGEADDGLLSQLHSRILELQTHLDRGSENEAECDPDASSLDVIRDEVQDVIKVKDVIKDEVQDVIEVKDEEWTADEATQEWKHEVQNKNDFQDEVKDEHEVKDEVMDDDENEKETQNRLLVQKATVKREEKRQGFLQELSSGAAAERRNKRKENPDPEKLQKHNRAKRQRRKKNKLAHSILDALLAMV